MHIHLHHHADPEVARELARLNRNLEKLMSDIDDFVSTTLAKISAQKTQIDSVTALLASIKHQLADALAGENLSASAKTKLAAIMPALETNTGEITDAINANTDAAPQIAGISVTSGAGGATAQATLTPTNTNPSGAPAS